MNPARKVPLPDRARRLGRLRQVLAQNQTPWFLISRPENLYYLAGFTGSSGIALMGEDRAVLLTDSRYAEQAREESPGWEVLITRKPWEEVGSALGGRVGPVAFEAAHLSYAAHQRLRETMPGADLQAADGWVEHLRRVKDAQEIEAVRHSSRVLSEALLAAAGMAWEGAREMDVAAKLEYKLRKGGAAKAAFDTIVASGERSALPHGVAGERRLLPGDLVVVDCGAVIAGYCSDVTRTYCMGEPTEKQRRIYDIVLGAQRLALERLRSGVPADEVDRAARDFIAAEGFAEAFSHGTGHGVGLSVHEEPRIAEGNKEPLEAGSVVTVEPGIYLEGWGGVRIEDLVLVTDVGIEVLTASVPKGMLGRPEEVGVPPGRETAS